MLAIGELYLILVSSTLVNAAPHHSNVERAVVDCEVEGQKLFELIQEYLDTDLSSLVLSPQELTGDKHQAKQRLIDTVRRRYKVDLSDEADIKRIACDLKGLTSAEQLMNYVGIQLLSSKMLFFTANLYIRFMERVGLDSLQRYQEMAIRVIAGIQKIRSTSSKNKMLAEIKAIQKEYGKDFFAQLAEPFNVIMDIMGSNRIDVKKLRKLNSDKLATLLAASLTNAEIAAKTGLKVDDVYKITATLHGIKYIADGDIEIYKTLAPLNQRAAKLLDDLGLFDLVKNASFASDDDSPCASSLTQTDSVSRCVTKML